MPQGVRRSISAIAVAVVLLLTAAAGAAGAKGTDGPASGPRIVGGTESAAGAWPSQAALLVHGEADRYNAQFCGATVIAPDWILTAGHCVHDDDGNPTPADTIDVLAGTQDLTTGGQRVQAVEARTAPGWSIDTLVNDVALLRLDHPVSAPAMPLVAQGHDVAAGTDLITSGWGNRSSTGNDFPTTLYEVHVPLVSDANCQKAYPASPNEYFAASMICAGLLGVGGKDSCNGDSGGPISAQINGIWTEIGTVSWGIDCAKPAFPGIYARLSSFSNWVKNQIRYGAQPDAPSFVRQQYRDFTGAAATDRQVFLGALTTRSGSLSDYVAGLEKSPGWQGTAAAVARLYLAYFGRNADTSGMSTWVTKLEHGGKLDDVSSAFAASSEFQTDYGSLSDADFVNLVYTNLLGRPADAGGTTYWTNQLATHAKTRGQVMTGFSESNEFRTKTRATTDVTTTYFALLRRVPTTIEYGTWTAQPNVNLVRSILSSVSYANRF